MPIGAPKIAGKCKATRLIAEWFVKLVVVPKVARNKEDSRPVDSSRGFKYHEHSIGFSGRRTAAMPHSSYFICTSPQSGQSVVGHALKGISGIVAPEEYFDPQVELYWRRKLRARKEQDLLQCVVSACARPNARFGVTVQCQHWSRLCDMLPQQGGSIVGRLESVFGQTRFIWLRRGNKPCQVVAWYRDIVLRQEKNADMGFDLIRACELLRRIEKYDRDWEAFFKCHDIAPFVINYEDLHFDWQDTIHNLSRFLDVDVGDGQKSSCPAPTSVDDASFSWLRRLTNARPELREKTPWHAKAAEELALGGRYFGRNDLSRAEMCFRKALEWDPLAHAALHNYAATVAAQGKRDAAILFFRRAIEVRPEGSDTHRNLGLAYAQQGRFEEAEASFRSAVDAAPNSTAMHYELAQFLRSVRRFDEAAAEYRKTVEIAADHADAWYALGNCCAELKRTDQAKAAYQQAVRIRPEFPEAHNNLGVIYEESGDAESAKRAYEAALTARPEWPEALNNLGVVLAGQGDYVAAERRYRQALSVAPDSASVLNNLGNTLRSQGKLDEAVAVLRRSLELKPHYSEAYNNLGIALMNQGLPNEAIAHYNQALYFVPDYPEPHLNRSLAWLSLADFDNGWVEYEWRWRGKHFGQRNYKQPRWDGGDLTGRTIFLYAEQGLGDTLQFIRYAQLVKQRGATVVAQVQSSLLPILRSFTGVDRWIESNEQPPDKFDVHAPLLSLPGTFKTNANSIPAPIPYLAADPKLIEAWRERLSCYTGFRIGIAWQGNPQYRGDRMRSPPLSQFATLARTPDVTLISLQVKHGLDQIAANVDEFTVHNLAGLDEASGAFMDTAAVMKNLDLIIASDSAVVHLAGALGVPVWVPLPLAADWRWFRNREDSPWYPTMRLFRQKKAGEWDDVFGRMANALRLRTSRRSPATSNPLTSSASSFQEGTSLAKAGKLAEAEAKLRQAVQEDGDSAIAAHNLGVVLALQKNLTDAVEYFRRAVAAAPEYAEAHGNLGLACLELGHTDEAIFEFQTALAQGANAAAMHNNLGAAMMDAGRPQEAVGAYRQALLLDPNFAEAHLNLGRALLALGKYEEGWLEYEWRRRSSGFRIRKLNIAVWAGEPLRGRPLLIHDDAPAEDFFQLLRYADLAERRGARVSVVCPESWAPVVRCFRGISSVLAPSESLSGFAAQAVLSGLPGLFKTSLESVPRNGPYLELPPDLAQRGRTAFRADERLKVALVRPLYDRVTQVGDFRGLESLLGHPRVQVVRLPVWNDSVSDVAEPRIIESENHLTERYHSTNDVMRLAAWINSADLVVTADGPECHLAGACGKSTMLLLETVGNWRWMQNRCDTPWYPQMKLVRRRPHESQSDYMRRVAEGVIDG